jgi:hypothetical protein
MTLKNHRTSVFTGVTAYCESVRLCCFYYILIFTTSGQEERFIRQMPGFVHKGRTNVKPVGSIFLRMRFQADKGYLWLVLYA